MKKISVVFVMLLFFAATGSLSARLVITIKAPTVSTGDPGLDTQINDALTAAVADYTAKLYQSDLSTLGDQKKLAASFGDAASYASQSTSFAGYQGYDIFALMFGASVSMQAPAFPKSWPEAKQISGDIKTDIQNDKDSHSGIGLSSTFNLGLNINPIKKMIGLGRVLPKRLYMNVKYFSLSRDFNNIKVDATTLGMGLNYQLVDRGGSRFNFFKWTGLSLGTGFVYNSNTINIKSTFAEYLSDAVSPLPGTSVTMGFAPETNFGLDIKTYSIPLDISTSVRILWILNLTAGLGVDLTYGKSEIIARGNGIMTVYNNGVPLTLGGDQGSFDIDAGTKGKPSTADFRFTGGVGICLGPLPIDIKINVYPFNNAASVNLSTGIVW